VIVELSIGKLRYKITCEESEQNKLLHLANKLNERVNNLSIHLKNADEKTLLVIAALMAEDELEQKTTHELQESEIEDDNKLNDQDVYDAVSENMENISDYITKLSKKIQNY